MRPLVVLLIGCLATGLQAESPVDRLSEAVQIQTVSHQDPLQFDPAPFHKYLAFLEESYPRIYAELDVHVINDFSLLFEWQGSRDDLKPILIDAHYDVVPVEPGTEDDWEFAPFSGEVKDGYLLGRGALDNKSPAMASFEVIEKLLAEGFQPERTLFYSLGHDEEIGGTQGAAAIARTLAERDIRFEFMLGEGGIIVDYHPILPGKTVVMVNLAQKGYLTLEVYAEGEGGHSSAPVENNALARVAAAVAKLHASPFEAKLVSPVSDMLEGLGNHADGLTGFALRNQWLTESFLVDQLESDPVMRSMVRTTTAVTMFNSGIKENVIPQRASAKVNFRLLPGDTEESLIAEVHAIVNDPLVQVRSSGSNVIPRVADKNGIGYQKLQLAVTEVLPDAVMVPSLLIATTNTRHYEDLADNVYHFQPFYMSLEDARGIHGTNEKVKVEYYLKSIELMEAVLRHATAP